MKSLDTYSNMLLEGVGVVGDWTTKGLFGILTRVRGADGILAKDVSVDANIAFWM